MKKKREKKKMRKKSLVKEMRNEKNFFSEEIPFHALIQSVFGGVE